MPLKPSEVAHLVTAMLAVNFYPTDRVANLLPAFQSRGLLDPAVASKMDRDEIMGAMRESGYARGGFLPILWYRHQQLMEAISNGALDILSALVQSGDEAGFKAKLASLHGWGPVTAHTAWILWRSDFES
jgi:hypothetical protein